VTARQLMHAVSSVCRNHDRGITQRHPTHARALATNSSRRCWAECTT